MTRELRYRDQALSDLNIIAAYTRREHGIAQMKRYLDAIADPIEKLALRPQSGADASQLRPGMRKIKAGKHVVFYTELADAIEIVRVLHERMDASGRLG
jgi:toxin ParE1/3/4